MKLFIFLIVTCCCLSSISQTVIHKSYTVQPGQKINFKFDYPKIIRISTWNKNEISIQASVTINNGREDDKFILEDKSDKETIAISNKAINFNGVDQRSYSIITTDGIKQFDNKKACDDFVKNNDLENISVKCENNLEIVMEIKVPQNMFTRLKSVYGMVELRDFSNPADIEAVYGGIDASLSEKLVGSLSVEVKYGEIYSDLDLSITNKKEEDFETAFSAKLGTGAALSLESGYGNIYLRKAL